MAGPVRHGATQGKGGESSAPSQLPHGICPAEVMAPADIIGSMTAARTLCADSAIAISRLRNAPSNARGGSRMALL